jgi:hypothetical protein
VVKETWDPTELAAHLRERLDPTQPTGAQSS